VRPRLLPVALALAVGLGGSGCRPGSVEVVLGAAPGDAYAYRYDVEAVVIRSVDGGADEERRTSSTLQVDLRVVEVEPDGRVRAEVALTRDGGPVQRAVVRLDRAGSLAAVEALDGVPTEELGLGGLDGLLLADGTAPPGELRPGQTWVVDRGSGDGSGAVVTGSGRLDRLTTSGGHRAAVASTELVARVESDVPAGSSAAHVDAEQRSTGTTAYDLGDGAVRWARMATDGTARVTIDPPVGATGPPVVADVRYEVSVITRRR
jgi:hypothetical protein